MDITRQRARLVVAAAMIAGVLAGSAGGAAGRQVTLASAAAATSPRLTSVSLTSVGQDGKPATGPSTQAALAENGRYVAFQSLDGPGQESSIYLRDIVGGTTTLVSDPGAGDATGPTISANGGLVGWEQGGDVYVAARQAGKASGAGGFTVLRMPVRRMPVRRMPVLRMTVRRVTGTARDLPYEQVVGCPAGIGPAPVSPCGPRLSADGSTLVYPAELTPVSPDLTISASLDESGGGSAGPLTGDTLDLTPYYPGGFYGDPGGTEATVSYTNNGASAMPFGSVTVTEPPGFDTGEPFELGQDTCGGTLPPGGSCTVYITFGYGQCAPDTNQGPQLVTGELVTHSPVPAGQSMIELTGLCYLTETGALQTPEHGAAAVTTGYRAAAAPIATAGASCPAPPRGLALTSAPATAADIEGAPVSDAGAAEIGRPYLVWLPVAVPAQAGGSANVVFAGPDNDDCGIRLVSPAGLRLADPLPPGAAPACYQDETLTSPAPPPSSPPASSPPASSPPASSPPASPPPSSPSTFSAAASSPAACTAYLLISPGAVAPDAAFLGTTFEQSYYGLNVAPTAYLTAQGVRHVIVARRNPSGAGNFAAAPSTVVSVTGQGAELPGATEPSVSADGRYVGFAAPVPIGSRGQQVAAGASQVWLHDSGPPGGKPGPTTLVSCLPRPRPGPCQAAANAGSPSVSGDGRQVAFASTAAVTARNGYPGTGSDTAQPAGQVSPDQVYVWTTAARVTTLVSWSPCRIQKCGGNGPSYAPVITGDGQTVGFVSRASDLTGTRVPAGTANLYLGAASGRGTSEMVSAAGASLPAGTSVGMPSLDAIGRLAAFPASDALVPAAPAGVASVYTFDRRPRLTASPGPAAFGTVLVDSGARSVPVTVTDTGPGPGTVTGVAASGPFAVGGDGCAGALLSAGSRCTVAVTFMPSAAGHATGRLTVTTQDDGEPPVTGGVAATATVPAPRLSASPGLASFGQTTRVSGSFFPPGRKVTLNWSPGLGSAVAVTSGAGSFGAYMVIFPDDVIGPRQLVASTSAGVRASAPFLVQEPATEPPFTGNQAAS